MLERLNVFLGGCGGKGAKDGDCIVDYYYYGIIADNLSVQFATETSRWTEQFWPRYSSWHYKWLTCACQRELMHDSDPMADSFVIPNMNVNYLFVIISTFADIAMIAIAARILIEGFWWTWTIWADALRDASSDLWVPAGLQPRLAGWKFTFLTTEPRSWLFFNQNSKVFLISFPTYFARFRLNHPDAVPPYFSWLDVICAVYRYEHRLNIFIIKSYTECNIKKR